ncbi:cytochrome c oxidase accessory protein CcoG [Thalassotalea sp. ND16A]|uniref:cytochrome c oxidase accessory protein CcoG n=1 Tax=Thalassotalea sp. ND16A TaxID=1535422 RepID=UPI00051D7866|nr:cytochrome c oxidase accessory protein CcoG [Thalassotalea sp. ND16A]KGJ98760.1 hypothetical protein ND16A_0563 [Thalassotalea sp. ND16A]
MVQKTSTDKGSIIFQTKAIDDKIYIKEQKGFYQSIRRYLSVALMMLFIVTPFIQYQGKQAILFDVEAQHLKVFSYYFYPQDLLIFTFVFIIAAFALFYVASKYGRIWCGFACPQTVWTLMFLWIENRIEGNRQQRIKLDKSKISIEKCAKKLGKHGMWLTVSLITALVFMSYFVPAEQIYIEFFTLNTTSIVTGWVWFFALCTYVNASWVREKMCQHMCPYARFQSVMFSDATSTVTYDIERGESRGPRKLNREKPQELGDCVDCNLCVQVCPVGIDIRDGLQYDCINCGLCIDACDQTMSKFSYAKGLIRFASETEQHSDSKAKYGYMALLLICVGFMANWLNNRSEFEVSVLKDRNALYRVNGLGEVENSYQLKILNKSDAKGHFKLSYQGLEGFRIESKKTLIVAPQQISNYTVTLIAPLGFKGKFETFDFVLQDESEEDKLLVTQSTFHSL